MGSNQGNRFAQLQNAVFALDVFAEGEVTCSPVYLSPSWGFDGPDFLNAVVSFETALPPREVLRHLQEIETAMGKPVRQGDTYGSRPIDLDIIFYGNEELRGPDLNIPHPHYTQRRFVLVPLADLAPGFTDPQTGRTVSESLSTTTDRSILRPFPFPLRSRPADLLREMKGICIEGNIGVGKTTLSEKLSGLLGAPLVLERFGKNPFLPSYYREPERFAFPVEMFFLYDRIQHWKEVARELGPFYVADYHLQKSQVFARNSLNDNEYRLFEDYFRLFSEQVAAPQLLIYLDASEEMLLKQIEKRGREYEKSIPRDYLESLRLTYEQMLPMMKSEILLKLDRSEMDWVTDPGQLDTFVRWAAGGIAEWLGSGYELGTSPPSDRKQ